MFRIRAAVRTLEVCADLKLATAIVWIENTEIDIHKYIYTFIYYIYEIHMGHALPIYCSWSKLDAASRLLSLLEGLREPILTSRPPELFWFGTTHRKIIYSFSVQIAEVRGVVSSAIKVDQIIKTCIPNPAFRLLSKQSAPKARPDN